MNLSNDDKKGFCMLREFLTEWIKRTSVEDFIKMKKEVSGE